MGVFEVGEKVGMERGRGVVGKRVDEADSRVLLTILNYGCDTANERRSRSSVSARVLPGTSPCHHPYTCLTDLTPHL
jgi:hypothetical protein